METGTLGPLGMYLKILRARGVSAPGSGTSGKPGGSVGTFRHFRTTRTGILEFLWITP